MKNSVNLKNRMTDLQYQFLKDNTASHTDQEVEQIAESLLDGIIKEFPDSQIVDAEMPTQFFSCQLDWTPGTANDKTVKITKGSHFIEKNLQ